MMIPAAGAHVAAAGAQARPRRSRTASRSPDRPVHRRASTSAASRSATRSSTARRVRPSARRGPQHASARSSAVQPTSERMPQDWQLQLEHRRAATLAQIDAPAHRRPSRQLAVAQRDLEITRAARSRTTRRSRAFLTGQVRQRPALPAGWPGGCPGLYFQAYNHGLRDGAVGRAGLPVRAGRRRRRGRLSSGRPTGRAGATGCSPAKPSAWTCSGWARPTFDGDARGLEITKRVSLRRARPGGPAGAAEHRGLRVRADRGAVRPRLPRPLPAPDPHGLGRPSSTPTASPSASTRR